MFFFFYLLKRCVGLISLSSLSKIHRGSESHIQLRPTPASRYELTPTCLLTGGGNGWFPRPTHQSSSKTAECRPRRPPPADPKISLRNRKKTTTTRLLNRQQDLSPSPLMKLERPNLISVQVKFRCSTIERAPRPITWQAQLNLICGKSHRYGWLAGCVLQTRRPLVVWGRTTWKLEWILDAILLLHHHHHHHHPGFDHGRRWSIEPQGDYITYTHTSPRAAVAVVVVTMMWVSATPTPPSYLLE